MQIRFAAALILMLPTVAVGVEPFKLPDTSGKQVAPLSTKDQKALVVVFIGIECPINNGYMPRLTELRAKYGSKGVGFVAINSNQQDSPKAVAEHAKKFELPFPVLKDANNVVADQFGAKRVPEAFLLDSHGKILYHGRIDDQIGIGFKRPAPTRKDLVEAIDEFLAGKPVSVPATDVAGCLISRVEKKSAAAATVTYTNDVAAILERRCVECHRAGQIGPMSLRKYDDAAAWASPIEEAVKDGRMPPWHAGPGFGPFSNDRRLSDVERKTLLTWIEQGCPKGEGEAPAGREFVEGWTIGKPDAEFEMSEEFKVPAQAPPWGVPYKYFVVDTNFDADRWVTAAQARPRAREVVHHIIVYVVPPGERRTRGEDGIGNGFLVSFAPGDKPFFAGTDAAKKIPKGAKLIFQMHYTPNGRAQVDRSSVGLIFAKEPPKHEVKVRAIAQNKFAIPPGDGSYRVDSTSTFRKDTLVLTLSPHMHLRGKDFEFRAVLPDGTKRTLLAIPRYDFNWQTTYHFSEPVKLPAGSRIECMAHFDNSENNPNNPDPKATVRWGDQTWQEMMIGFVDYVYLDEKK
jgi:peroxiredoxin/mono/diheme cytochrome c family protein